MRKIEVLVVGIAILAASLVSFYAVQKDKEFYARIDQDILTLLKGNIDNDAVFEGTLSYFGQRFYVNKDDLLQIDGFQQNLCEQLQTEGYNCQSGILVTKLSIDPMISLQKPIKDAEILIAKSEMLVEIINKTSPYNNK